MNSNVRDLIIIGGGPAGLSAGIYAKRYKLDTLLFAREPGGIAGTAHKICNYPGFSEISGFLLMQKIEEHARNLELEIKYDSITKIEKNNEGIFEVNTFNEKYFSKKIIFATGTERKKLLIKGEEELYGKGVSYCATCDGAFFKNKSVAVIGGSDAALTAALLLSEFASDVTIIYRQNSFFRAEPAWIDLVEKNEKIKTLFNEEVEEVIGTEKVESVRLKSGKMLNIDGVFVEIGSAPNNNIISTLNIETEKNYIVVDKNQKTSVHGFFAAGDITNNPLKQIVTGTGEGAIAAFSVFQELRRESSDKK